MSEEVLRSSFGSTTTGNNYKRKFLPEPGYEELADAIQRRLSTEPVLKEYGMRLKSSFCNETYTAVSTYLLNCCKELSRRVFVKGLNATFDVMGIITMYRSSKFGGAEKKGNLDPVFIAGERAKRIIDEGVFFKEGETLLPLDENGEVDVESEEFRTALAIQTQTAKELVAYDINFNPSDFSIYVLAAMYLKCAIEEVKERALESKSGECEFVIYTFASFKVTSGREGLRLTFYPGEDGKKIVKSDANTEGD
jgi:hypothetical protein